MKKLFHRKKHDETSPGEDRSRRTTDRSTDSGVRTSLYESTTAGGMPQNGDYPLKGNDDSVLLQTGRKSSIRSMRSRRSSSRGSQNHYDTSRRNPRSSPPPQASAQSRHPQSNHNPYQSSVAPVAPQDDSQKRWSRSPLPDQFSGLNLGDGQGPTTVTSTVTTTTRTPHRLPAANSSSHQNQEPTPHHRSNGSGAVNHAYPAKDSYGARGAAQPPSYTEQNNPGLRKVNHGDIPNPASRRQFRNDPEPEPRGYGHESSIRQQDFNDLSRQKSIPRKQVGTSAQTPHDYSEPSHSSYPQLNHNQAQRPPKALPSTPSSTNDGYTTREAPNTPNPPSILDRSRPVSKGFATPRAAQDVVDRAKTNTYDTEVVEKVAPAVVHENVTKNVHHIREEVITREIHTHDNFHRILPIIDVEVLPPRHFLPVEGGGLVEVSAAEVPGRGQNWVIAETASKIPSDQTAPQGRRQFTARSFPGKEGDAKQYISPEGFEKTEQTWVHAPELEIGAKLTGQSWPMVFEDEVPDNTSRADANAMAGKSRSPKKSSAIQANPAQKAGAMGRMR